MDTFVLQFFRTIMNTRVVSWLLLFGLVLTWGSSFILIKKGLLYFDPVALGALRVAITFVFLLPVALKRIRKLDIKSLFWIGISGIVGNLFPAFLFSKAQTGIDSSTAGLLNSLTPMFTIIAGFVLFKIRVRLLQIMGVIVGLAGAVGLIQISGGNSFGFNIHYASFVMLATVFYAINVNLIKARLFHLDALTIASVAFFVAGFPALIILFGFSGFTRSILLNPQWYMGFIYISILAIIGTGIAMIAFNELIKITSPVFASSVTYMIPIVALLWGVADNELFSLQHIIWIALILGGVVLVNIDKYRFPVRVLPKLRNRKTNKNPP